MRKKKSLDHLLELSLRHLYSVEQQTYDFLDKSIEMAQSAQLRNALIHHQEQTGHQIQRLKQSFDILHMDVELTPLSETEGLLEKGKKAAKKLATLILREKSKGMEGIIQEAVDCHKPFANTEIHDLTLASGGQPVEQFEITQYTNVLLLANHLEHEQVEKLLNTSLEEEREASVILRQIVQDELKQISRRLKAHA